MWCNQIFSFISKNEAEVNTVQNIAVCDNYETANQLARAIYGDEAIAVDTTQIPVAIGDVYETGNFYRDGVVISPNPTEEQEIAALKAENAELLESAVDNDYRLSMIELGL